MRRMILLECVKRLDCITYADRIKRQHCMLSIDMQNTYRSVLQWVRVAILVSFFIFQKFINGSQNARSFAI